MAAETSTISDDRAAYLIPQGSHAGRPPIPLKRPIIVIGSRKEIVRLHLESSTVSKAHCAIVLNDWGCYIHDLASRTHTWVNGEKVTDADLNDGDRVKIGRFEFEYRAPKLVSGQPRRAPGADLDVSTLTDALPLSKRVVQIGRRLGSDLQFEDKAVSNIHTLIFERNGQRIVRDMGSRTGTWIESQPIHQEILIDGAVVRIGPASLTYREVAPEPAYPVPFTQPPEAPQIAMAGLALADEAPIEVELSPSDDVDPLVELRRGWHGKSAPAEEIPIEIEPEVEAPPVETPAAETPAAEVDADALALEALSSEAVDEAPIEIADESGPVTPAEPVAEAPTAAIDLDALVEPVAEPEVVEPVVEPPTELAAIDLEPLAIQPVAIEPVAEVAAPEPEPLDLEPLAMEPVEPVAEAPVAEPEAPVAESAPQEPTSLGDITDDDGAVDLETLPPAPVADAIAEPDLALESDSAGLESAPEVVAETPTPVESPEAASAVIDLGEPGSPKIEPEPEIDLSGINFAQPGVEVEAELEDERPMQDQVDLSELEVDEVEVIDQQADTALNVSFDVDDDPFDHDDSPAEPLINLADSIVAGEAPTRPEAAAQVEIVEPTHPTPESAMPDLLTEETDPDLAKIMEEIGIADDELPELPTSDGGEPVELEADQKLSEIDAELDKILPRDNGKLSDLIPSHGPLMGGAFMPGGPQLVVGGSPMVNLSKPPAKPTARPKTPLEPSVDDDASLPGTPPAPATDVPPEKRKPLRVGFGAAPSPATPFTTEDRTIADVLIGRRARQSVDVFANPSPTPEDLLLDESEKTEVASPAPDAVGSPEQRELVETAERFRPRGAIRALTDAPVIPPTAQPVDPTSHADLRKKRLHRALFFIILMLPAVAGAVWGVMHFVHDYSRLEASVSFPGLDQVSENRRLQIHSQQKELLQNESTQQDAVTRLDRTVRDPGFLKDVIQIGRALNPTRDPNYPWPSQRPNVMVLQVRSEDKQNDLARLRALAAALVQANKDQVARRAALKDRIDEDVATIKNKMVQIGKANDDLAKLAALGETRPDDAVMFAVEAKRKAAETDLRALQRQRMELESALEVIQKQNASELAPSVIEDYIAKDAELVKLKEQLAGNQKQIDAARTATSAKVAAAQKELDEIISKFQVTLDSAQKARDSVEFSRFVESRKRAFSLMRQLTDDLIHRQEQQRARLDELKQKLSDRIEARTQEKLGKDKDLKRLKDELGMLTRQQNAAAAEGMAEESQKFEMQMRLLKVKIEETEYQYKNDPVNQEIIGSLQELVQQTEKSIREDRKHVDETLARSQEEFTKSAPSVEQLPDDQKQLAEGIEKQLAAVADARKAYSTTVAAAEADLAKLEVDVKTESDKLQAQITSRLTTVEEAAAGEQSRVAEANRAKRLGEKKLELTAMIEKEKAQQIALDAVIADQTEKQEHRRKVVATEQQRDEKLAERKQLEDEIRKLNQGLGPKQADLANIVIPDETVEIQSFDEDLNRRPLFAAGAGGGVLLLMLIPIVWNLRLAARDTHAHMPTKTPNGSAFDPIMPAAPSANGAEQHDPAAVN